MITGLTIVQVQPMPDYVAFIGFSSKMILRAVCINPLAYVPYTYFNMRRLLSAKQTLSLHVMVH